MSICHRCRRHVPVEDSGLCEPCEEAREERRRSAGLPIVCSHCGGVFDETAYERHAWRIFYRRGIVPKGRRKTRP